jgi:hypothetical protein
MMTASKKVRHIVQFRILFLFHFLSLATGTGKGDTPKGILLREGSGPRALLLIRGSKAGSSEGFDSHLRALGLRAHYWSEVRRLAPQKGSTAASEHAERGMTLGTSDTWPRLRLRSRGTLGHFRDQRERFCNRIPSEGGIEPSDPIKRDRVRQITCRYFWSAPLGPLADPYRTGHGRPLGSPVSNSLETPCSAPSEGNMALSPLLLAERRRRGV